MGDNQIYLPTFDMVYAKSLKNGEDSLNPIERFILDNEPAGIEDEQKFRKQLYDIILYLT